MGRGWHAMKSILTDNISLDRCGCADILGLEKAA
jgi:hypothetical protein